MVISTERVDRHARLASVVLWVTVVGGFAAIVWSLLALYQSAAWAAVLPFLGLAVVADLLGVELVEDKRERWTLSLAIAVMMAAVAFNPLVAPLVGLADGLIHVARSKTRRIDKMLFNLTNVSLATGLPARSTWWCSQCCTARASASWRLASARSWASTR